MSIFTAWVTTRECMPEASPTIDITISDNDGEHISVLNPVVDVSGNQTDSWGILPEGGFDTDAADKLLDEMGYHRVEDWIASGNSWCAQVKR